MINTVLFPLNDCAETRGKYESPWFIGNKRACPHPLTRPCAAERFSKGGPGVAPQGAGGRPPPKGFKKKKKIKIWGIFMH